MSVKLVFFFPWASIKSSTTGKLNWEKQKLGTRGITKEKVTGHTVISANSVSLPMKSSEPQMKLSIQMGQ
jgi:hypothetical protein